MYFYIIAQKIKNTKILHNSSRSLQDELQPLIIRIKSRIFTLTRFIHLTRTTQKLPEAYQHNPHKQTFENVLRK